MHVNWLMVAGFLLVLVGAVLPFLMVVYMLPKSLFLSFLSYFCSIVGLFLGLIGAGRYAIERRNRDDE